MWSKSLFKTVFLVLGLVLLLAGAAAAAEKVPVFVSIVPEQYFLEKIGGDRVAVSVMVLPGAEPATYEPTPRQMAELTRAKAYFAIGVPFESTWLDRIHSANPAMRMVDAAAGIRKVPMMGPDHDHDGHGPAGTPPSGTRPEGAPMAGAEPHDMAGGHGPEHGHEHGILDPHIWLSPVLVKTIAGNICNGLVAVDPAGKTVYEKNLNAFLAELDALDGQLKSIFTSLAQDRRTFMVFHPAWGYFARAYGLRQIPIESEGKEPSPGALARIVDMGKAMHIPVVFVQPQFSERSAQVIASEMGAQVVPLDPLAVDWKDNMVRVAEAFRRALR